MPYRTPSHIEERKAEVRARILAAASDLFAAQGYEATTMQQIVKAAGTSIGNVYFYFPDKAALMLALIDELGTQVTTEIDARLVSAPLGRSRFAIAVYIGALAFLKRRELARVAFVEASQPAFRLALVTRFTARVQAIFETTPQLLGGLSPALAAHAWQGANYHVLEGVLDRRLPGDAEAIGRFLAQWNVQALGISPGQVRETMNELDEFIRRTNVEARDE
jgi:AcrR family transcriptional regulator